MYIYDRSAENENTYFPRPRQCLPIAYVLYHRKQSSPSSLSSSHIPVYHSYCSNVQNSTGSVTIDLTSDDEGGNGTAETAPDTANIRTSDQSVQNIPTSVTALNLERHFVTLTSDMLSTPSQVRRTSSTAVTTTTVTITAALTSPAIIFPNAATSLASSVVVMFPFSYSSTATNSSTGSPQAAAASSLLPQAQHHGLPSTLRQPIPPPRVPVPTVRSSPQVQSSSHLISNLLPRQSANAAVLTGYAVPPLYAPSSAAQPATIRPLLPASATMSHAASVSSAVRFMVAPPLHVVRPGGQRHSQFSAAAAYGIHPRVFVQQSSRVSGPTNYSMFQLQPAQQPIRPRIAGNAQPLFNMPVASSGHSVNFTSTYSVQGPSLATAAASQIQLLVAHVTSTSSASSQVSSQSAHATGVMSTGCTSGSQLPEFVDMESIHSADMPPIVIAPEGCAEDSDIAAAQSVSVKNERRSPAQKSTSRRIREVVCIDDNDDDETGGAVDIPDGGSSTVGSPPQLDNAEDSTSDSTISTNVAHETTSDNESAPVLDDIPDVPVINIAPDGGGCSPVRPDDNNIDTSCSFPLLSSMVNDLTPFGNETVTAGPGAVCCSVSSDTTSDVLPSSCASSIVQTGSSSTVTSAASWSSTLPTCQTHNLLSGGSFLASQSSDDRNSAHTVHHFVPPQSCVSLASLLMASPFVVPAATPAPLMQPIVTAPQNPSLVITLLPPPSVHPTQPAPVGGPPLSACTKPVPAVPNTSDVTAMATELLSGLRSDAMRRRATSAAKVAVHQSSEPTSAGSRTGSRDSSSPSKRSKYVPSILNRSSRPAKKAEKKSVVASSKKKDGMTVVYHVNEDGSIELRVEEGSISESTVNRRKRTSKSASLDAILEVDACAHQSWCSKTFVTNVMEKHFNHVHVVRLTTDEDRISAKMELDAPEKKRRKSADEGTLSEQIDDIGLDSGSQDTISLGLSSVEPSDEEDNQTLASFEEVENGSSLKISNVCSVDAESFTDLSEPTVFAKTESPVVPDVQQELMAAAGQAVEDVEIARKSSTYVGDNVPNVITSEGNTECCLYVSDVDHSASTSAKQLDDSSLSDECRDEPITNMSLFGEDNPCSSDSEHEGASPLNMSGDTSLFEISVDGDAISDSEVAVIPSTVSVERTVDDSVSSVADQHRQDLMSSDEEIRRNLLSSDDENGGATPSGKPESGECTTVPAKTRIRSDSSPNINSIQLGSRSSPVVSLKRLPLSIFTSHVMPNLLIKDGLCSVDECEENRSSGNKGNERVQTVSDSGLDQLVEVASGEKTVVMPEAKKSPLLSNHGGDSSAVDVDRAFLVQESATDVDTSALSTTVPPETSCSKTHHNRTTVPDQPMSTAGLGGNNLTHTGVSEVSSMPEPLPETDSNWSWLAEAQSASPTWSSYDREQVSSLPQPPVESTNSALPKTGLDNSHQVVTKSASHVPRSMVDMGQKLVSLMSMAITSRSSGKKPLSPVARRLSDSAEHVGGDVGGLDGSGLAPAHLAEQLNPKARCSLDSLSDVEPSSPELPSNVSFEPASHSRKLGHVPVFEKETLLATTNQDVDLEPVIPLVQESFKPPVQVTHSDSIHSDTNTAAPKPKPTHVVSGHIDPEHGNGGVGRELTSVSAHVTSKVSLVSHGELKSSSLSVFDKSHDVSPISPDWSSRILSVRPAASKSCGRPARFSLASRRGVASAKASAARVPKKITLADYRSRKSASGICVADGVEPSADVGIAAVCGTTTGINSRSVTSVPSESRSSRFTAVTTVAKGGVHVNNKSRENVYGGSVDSENFPGHSTANCELKPTAFPPESTSLAGDLASRSIFPAETLDVLGVGTQKQDETSASVVGASNTPKVSSAPACQSEEQIGETLARIDHSDIALAAGVEKPLVVDQDNDEQLDFEQVKALVSLLVTEIEKMESASRLDSLPSTEEVFPPPSLPNGADIRERGDTFDSASDEFSARCGAATQSAEVPENVGSFCHSENDAKPTVAAESNMETNDSDSTGSDAAVDEVLPGSTVSSRTDKRAERKKRKVARKPWKFTLVPVDIDNHGGYGTVAFSDPADARTMPKQHDHQVALRDLPVSIPFESRQINGHPSGVMGKSADSVLEACANTSYTATGGSSATMAALKNSGAVAIGIGNKQQPLSSACIGEANPAVDVTDNTEISNGRHSYGIFRATVCSVVTKTGSASIPSDSSKVCAASGGGADVASSSASFRYSGSFISSQAGAVNVQAVNKSSEDAVPGWHVGGTSQSSVFSLSKVDKISSVHSTAASQCGINTIAPNQEVADVPDTFPMVICTSAGPADLQRRGSEVAHSGVSSEKTPTLRVETTTQPNLPGASDVAGRPVDVTESSGVGRTDVVKKNWSGGKRIRPKDSHLKAASMWQDSLQHWVGLDISKNRDVAVPKFALSGDYFIVRQHVVRLMKDAENLKPLQKGVVVEHVKRSLTDTWNMLHEELVYVDVAQQLDSHDDARLHVHKQIRRTDLLRTVEAQLRELSEAQYNMSDAEAELSCYEKADWSTESSLHYNILLLTRHMLYKEMSILRCYHNSRLMYRLPDELCLDVERQRYVSVEGSVLFLKYSILSLAECRQLFALKVEIEEAQSDQAQLESVVCRNDELHRLGLLHSKRKRLLDSVSVESVDSLQTLVAFLTQQLRWYRCVVSLCVIN